MTTAPVWRLGELLSRSPHLHKLNTISLKPALSPSMKNPKEMTRRKRSDPNTYSVYTAVKWDHFAVSNRRYDRGALALNLIALRLIGVHNID